MTAVGDPLSLLEERHPAASARLLAAALSGAGPGLAEHLALHGPSPVSARGGPRPDQLVAEVLASGLTGRGGAGFPTARKLELLAAQRRRPVLVVNAMEGEPASSKDRTLLHHSPHLVLDGAQAAALAVGADEVVLCVADDDGASAEAVGRALHERTGAAADPIPVRLERPPGRYAAGEESALVDWVGGGRGAPSFRPDKGTPLTVRRSPVLVQNAETLAHVALVARHGATWFRTAGTPDAPGTALVTVSGAVARPGVLEVELGTPLAAVLEAAGRTEPVQTVLLGGFGGAWLPGALVDTPLAPGALAAHGASIGAGVVGVLPRGACAVAETARIVAYLSGERAGQCGPCTFGLPALADDLARLASGHADGRLLDRLETRLAAVDGRGACRLPDGAVRLTRSLLTSAADDVRAHARRRPCPAWNGRPVLPVPHPGPGPGDGAQR